MSSESKNKLTDAMDYYSSDNETIQIYTKLSKQEMEHNTILKEDQRIREEDKKIKEEYKQIKDEYNQVKDENKQIKDEYNQLHEQLKIAALNLYNNGTSKDLIMKSLNMIIKWLTFAIIPIGALLFWNQISLEGANLSNAVVQSVAAIIGMIPEGLVLLTSTVLAVSVVRLSKSKVLVQELFCIDS